MKTSYGACSEHTLQAWIFTYVFSVYKVVTKFSGTTFATCVIFIKSTVLIHKLSVSILPSATLALITVSSPICGFIPRMMIRRDENIHTYMYITLSALQVLAGGSLTVILIPRSSSIRDVISVFS